MTNLEYYGIDNLDFEDYQFCNRPEFYGLSKIYYVTRHSKENILLHSTGIVSDYRKAKVLWLLSEYKKTNWN